MTFGLWQTRTKTLGPGIPFDTILVSIYGFTWDWRISDVLRGLGALSNTIMWILILQFRHTWYNWRMNEILSSGIKLHWESSTTRRYWDISSAFQDIKVCVFRVFGSAPCSKNASNIFAVLKRSILWDIASPENLWGPWDSTNDELRAAKIQIMSPEKFQTDLAAISSAVFANDYFSDRKDLKQNRLQHFPWLCCSYGARQGWKSFCVKFARGRSNARHNVFCKMDAG